MGRDLGVGLGALLGLTGATWAFLGLPASYPAAAAGAYLVLAALLLLRLPRRFRAAAWGPPTG